MSFLQPFLLFHYDMEDDAAIVCVEGEQVDAVGGGATELHLFVEHTVVCCQCCAVYHLSEHVCYLCVHLAVAGCCQCAPDGKYTFAGVGYHPDVFIAADGLHAHACGHDDHAGSPRLLTHAVARHCAAYRVVARKGVAERGIGSAAHSRPVYRPLVGR